MRSLESREEQQSPHKISAGLHQIVAREMVVGIRALVHAAERALHGVDGWNFDIVEHSYTCCGFFGLLVSETRIVERKKWADFRQQIGVKPSFFWCLRIVAPVHEDVLSSTVAMEITE